LNNFLSSGGSAKAWELTPRLAGHWSGWCWAHAHTNNSSYLFTWYRVRYDYNLDYSE